MQSCQDRRFDYDQNTIQSKTFFSAEGVLIKKPDGRIIAKIGEGEGTPTDKTLVDSNNIIDESIFNQIFPDFDQVSGKFIFKNMNNKKYKFLYNYNITLL